MDYAAGANNAFWYPPGFNMSNVTAVDVSPVELAMNPSGTKIQADIRKKVAQIEGIEFDLALCIFGMRYVENQKTVVSEMLRHLKQNRWLVLIDFTRYGWYAVNTFKVEKLEEYVRSIGCVQTVSMRLTQERIIVETLSKQIPIDLFAVQK